MSEPRLVCICLSPNSNSDCPVGLEVGNHEPHAVIYEGMGCVEPPKSPAGARPSWDEYFLAAAHLFATRATCDRKHVGAVIVDERHRIVSSGYNGAPAGMPHCSGPGGVDHELKTIEGRQSCVRTLHAESNALDDAGRRARGCTLYVTVTPCYPCAQRLVNAGIRRVVYTEWYDSQNTDLVAEFFEKAGVEMVGPGKPDAG